MNTKYLIIACLLCSVGVQAQVGQYLRLDGALGLSGITGMDANARVGNELTPGGALSYGYFFTKNIGFQLGAGIENFRSSSTLKSVTEISAVDEDGDSYIFRTRFNNLKEKQTQLLLQIPASFRYRSALNSRLSLDAGLGGSVSIPFSSRYKTTAGTLTTSGVYEQWGAELTDLPQFGFQTYNGPFAGKSTIKTFYSLTVDLGCSYKIGTHTRLHFGAYANYGLTEALKKSDKPLFEYGGNYRGMLASGQIRKFSPASVGIKLGLSLDMGKISFHKRQRIDTISDTDGDGVRDFKDLCPNTPRAATGKVTSTGCLLDTDGDGVADYLDKCPDTPKEAYASVDSFGCPKDKDKDGVPDYLDKCSDTPPAGIAYVDSLGCPRDTDKDGVPDYLDRCPETPAEAAGKVDIHGCPLDTDGDGVPDYQDFCPDKKGLLQNHGCPEVSTETRMLFKRALHGVQFETGKSTIKPLSYNILIEIANVLLMNPEYKIEIRGHTDNVGKKDANLLLSGNRAEAVKRFLISKGIEADRMTSVGFGDSKPVATNKTSVGKAQNRRVEFLVSFEKIVKK